MTTTPCLYTLHCDTRHMFRPAHACIFLGFLGTSSVYFSQGKCSDREGPVWNTLKCCACFALPRVFWSYNLSTEMLTQPRNAFSIRSRRKKLWGFLCLNSAANFPFLFVSTHLAFDNSSSAGQFILGLKLLLFCLESLKNQPFARRCLVSLLSTEKPLTPFWYFENRFQTCNDYWFG